MIDTVIQFGATHVFGMVGDGIAPIIEAIRKRQDRLRYVLVYRRVQAHPCDGEVVVGEGRAAGRVCRVGCHRRIGAQGGVLIRQKGDEWRAAGSSFSGGKLVMA